MSHLPLPRSYHPLFIDPSRKPCCSVQIDWSHPLSHKLWGLYMMDTNNPINLVNGNKASLINSPDLLVRTEGKVYNFATTEGFILNNGTLGSRNVTVIGRCAYDSLNQDHAMFDVLNQNLILWADTNNSELRTSVFANGVPSTSADGTLGSVTRPHRYYTWGAQIEPDSGSTVQATTWVDSAIVAGPASIGAGTFDTSSDIRIGINQINQKGTNGIISFVAVWARTLSDVEFKSYSYNPYQILKPYDPNVYFLAPPPPPVTGTVASTLANTTMAGTGAEIMAGSVASTTANTTMVSAGELSVPGTFASTLADTALASVGVSTNIGTVTSTLADTTMASAGSLATIGTLSTTLADTQLVATGLATGFVEGPLADTLQDVSMAAIGDIPTNPIGTIGVTLNSNIMTAYGTTGTIIPITNTELSLTLDNLQVNTTLEVSLSGDTN